MMKTASDIFSVGKLITADTDYVRHLIKGKRVVILGSAPSVLKNTREKINNYDVIVRVNNYDMLKYWNNIGTRTDIYYSFFGRSIRKKNADLRRENVKMIWSRLPYADFRDHTKGKTVAGHSGDWRVFFNERGNGFFDGIPTYIPSEYAFLQNYMLLGRVLTTGVSAIIDVLKFEPSELYITGFDFFSSGKHNINETWKENDGNHDLEGEKKLVRKLWQKGRITIDNTIRGMM